MSTPIRVTSPLLDVLELLLQAAVEDKSLHGWSIMKTTKRSGPTVYGCLIGSKTLDGSGVDGRNGILTVTSLAAVSTSSALLAGSRRMRSLLLVDPRRLALRSDRPGTGRGTSSAEPSRPPPPRMAG